MRRYELRNIFILPHSYKTFQEFPKPALGFPKCRCHNSTYLTKIEMLIQRRFSYIADPFGRPLTQTDATLYCSEVRRES
jgi:hypothetical protein